MVVKSSFFNSLNGDRRYDAYRFAEYFASFIGNGVFINPSTSLQVVEKQNLTVSVKPGKGWINGYYVSNDLDFDLTLENADGLLSRIDRIVLQLNLVTREINILVKKGNFSSNPIGPELTRNAEIHELALAEILVRNGSISVTQSDITDTRLNNILCGPVHGVVDQVDTTTLFNQYQSWITEQERIFENDLTNYTAEQRISFEQFAAQQRNAIQEFQNEQNEDFINFRNTQQADFEAWYASIQDVLSGDVAANLASRISQVENSFNAHLTNEIPHTFTQNDVEYRYGFKANSNLDGLIFLYEEVQ